MLLFPFYDKGTAWDAIVNATKEDSKRWPFPEPFALQIFADACRGADALHSAGFVHRDIKPLVSQSVSVGDPGCDGWGGGGS